MRQYCKGDKVKIIRNSRFVGDSRYDLAEGIVNKTCTVKFDGGTSEGVIVFVNEDQSDWIWVNRNDISEQGCAKNPAEILRGMVREYAQENGLEVDEDAFGKAITFLNGVQSGDE